jgi:site-specific DNA-methyltransferase (adenine-specific)
MNIDLRQGDCLEVLKTIPDNSVDSVVTDPPYHLTSTKGDKKGFMGKDWDGGDIAFRTDVWSECLRVLKPGGHLLSFSHSRTYHRMAVAIEDAGFEIRDSIMWIYGSGFPKSHNIGKAIDKIEGNEREVGKSKGTFVSSGGQLNGKNTRTERFESKGQSDYEGWGTALKPAHEPICMARKPLSEKSIAENVLKWGTGGINIDGCRIEFSENDDERIGKGYVWDSKAEPFGEAKTTLSKEGWDIKGRFPANIILDEEAGKLLDEQSGIKQSQKRKAEYNKPTEHTNTYTPKASDYRDDNTYDDKGGASRFFYCPKTSKKERNAGIDNKITNESVKFVKGGLKCEICNKWKNSGSPCICDEPQFVEQPFNGTRNNNTHPTVKPIKLMEYLIKLVTPKGGVVMDCFMGSGSTGVAARNLGFKFIGIEREQEYMDIAKQRITQSVQTKLDL